MSYAADFGSVKLGHSIHCVRTGHTAHFVVLRQDTVEIAFAKLGPSALRLCEARTPLTLVVLSQDTADYSSDKYGHSRLW